MDFSELEQLIGMVKNSQVGELTLRQGEARLTLRKAPNPQGMSVALVPSYNSTHLELVGDEDEDDGIVEAPNLKLVETEEEIPITSPLVGIFHHVKPVVGLGAKVKAGQKIGLIEAMKLVNDVTAPADGTISDVLIEDGLPVEYGQTLFVLSSE